MSFFRKSVARLALGTLIAGLYGSLAVAAPGDQWTYEWPNTDFANTSVDLAEIFSGGPPKDGIPSIDEPQFAAVDDVDMEDREPVIGFSVGDDIRAYPLRVLMWHEIVNDVVGGIPVAITFCPLCNAAMVFDRRVNGQVLDFGTTGKLRHSDLVMYDRQSESWWQQFLGEAIVGSMTGTRLKHLPARIESFAKFRSRAPEGKILVPSFSLFRSYGKNPYEGYDSLATPWLYRGAMPTGIAPLARVITVGQEAWSLDLLREVRTITRDDMVITWEPGQASALDTAIIANGFDVGNVTVQRKTDGGTLQDIAYGVDFAFAFNAFYPDGTIHLEAP